LFGTEQATTEATLAKTSGAVASTKRTFKKRANIKFKVRVSLPVNLEIVERQDENY
jgi:hypothetical protein